MIIPYAFIVPDNKGVVLLCQERALYDSLMAREQEIKAMCDRILLKHDRFQVLTPADVMVRILFKGNLSYEKYNNYMLDVGCATLKRNGYTIEYDNSSQHCHEAALL